MQLVYQSFLQEERPDDEDLKSDNARMGHQKLYASLHREGQIRAQAGQFEDVHAVALAKFCAVAGC